jgi:hypothetical protein
MTQAQSVAVDLTAVNSRPEVRIGQRHIEPDGAAYEYFQSSGGTAAGLFNHIDSTGLAVLATTALVGAVPFKIGVACTTLPAGSYGWFFRGKGNYTAVVANAVAAGTKLTTTATPGHGGTGGTAIHGVKNTALGVTNTRVGIFAAEDMIVNP